MPRHERERVCTWETRKRKQIALAKKNSQLVCMIKIILQKFCENQIVRIELAHAMVSTMGTDKMKV